MFGVRFGLAGALLCAYLGFAGPASAATIEIVNNDAAGEGLNDLTPRAPEGGNSGTTLGEQRRIALAYAADILASRVASTVTIRVAARFDDLDCSAASAALGRAGPSTYAVNFSGAPQTDRFYPVALAHALRGRRLSNVDDDIDARFSASLDAGDSQCLRGRRWYYGLDSAQPDNSLNFLSTAVHELLHGLGFISLVALTDGTTRDAGQFPATTRGERFADIYSAQLQDLSLAGQRYWTEMTDAERAQSIRNGTDVVFGDSNTANAAAAVLDAGLNQGRVSIYAPDPPVAGSSISHWDTGLDPDAIMEPFATGRDDVTRGIGLAACVLEAIGWTLINGTRCADVDSTAIAGADEAPPPDETPVDEPDAGGDTEASDSGGAARSDDDGGSGGGGCTLDPDARFDPLWLALCIGAIAVLRWRRRPACGRA